MSNMPMYESTLCVGAWTHAPTIPRAQKLKSPRAQEAFCGPGWLLCRLPTTFWLGGLGARD